MKRRPEEDHGEMFGQNLFEAANHDQKWIITQPETDKAFQAEFSFIGTEYEVKMAAKSLGGTYRRADSNEKR